MFFFIFVASAVALVLGYIFYGRFMAKKYNLCNAN